MLLMFVFKRYKVPETRLQNTESFDIKQNDKTTSPQPTESLSKTKIIFTVLISISLCFYTGIEMNYFGNSSTYHQFLPIRVSAQTAADLMTLMTTTYTMGRLSSAYISSKLSPEVMISYHFVIITIALSILHFLQHSMTFIWIGNALIGNTTIV